jgi:hypothetical protein
MCPILGQFIIGFYSFFFLLRLFTVLMKQTRQAVRAVKQSIFLDVYGITNELRDGKRERRERIAGTAKQLWYFIWLQL